MKNYDCPAHRFASGDEVGPGLQRSGFQGRDGWRLVAPEEHAVRLVYGCSEPQFVWLPAPHHP